VWCVRALTLALSLRERGQVRRSRVVAGFQEERGDGAGEMDLRLSPVPEVVGTHGRCKGPVSLPDSMGLGNTERAHREGMAMGKGER
jgi:hypothetical protein